MIKAKLIEQIKLTQDVSSFIFDLGGKEFNYIPGQFIKLNFLEEIDDPRSSFRFFSISSSLQDNFLSITTKNTGSIFKNKLFTLKDNSEIEINGPYGRFTLNNITSNVVFISGGMGITPFRSILKNLKNIKLNKNIYLFASFKTKSESIFFDELSETAKNNEKIHVFYYLTREANVAGFESGRIGTEVIKSSVPNFESSIFYISGPPAMVDSVSNMIIEGGVDQGRIKTEKFTGY